MAHCMLTPYSKKKLTPKDIILFEWEKKEEKEHTQVKIATREDFERVKKEYGG